MASKFKGRLTRLHQSRVRASDEQLQNKPTGVYEADASGSADPNTNDETLLNNWSDYGFSGTPLTLETVYRSSQKHGQYRLADLTRTSFPMSPTGQLGFDIHPTKVAFFDIETNGLADGSVAFCLGLGRWTGESFAISQIALDEVGNEKDTLEKFSEMLADCEALVTFNGKSFDVPRTRSRLKAHGLPDPFAELYHLDLLHLARRLFPTRSSLGLTELEKDLLFFHRAHDVPGSEAPPRYRRYQNSRDPEPLIALFDHNRLDILSLAALSTHFDAWIRGEREPAPTPSPSVVSRKPWKAESELTQRLSQTYRLRKSRGHRQDPPVQPVTSPPQNTRPDGSRLAEMRNKAEALIQSGRSDEALPILYEIVTLAPRHAFAIRELATYYRNSGDVALARVFDERLKAIAPY